MAEESTTPKVLELVRRSVQAAQAMDFDTLWGYYRPDAVYDMSPMGLGIYEGLAAIRAFFEDWLSTFEEFALEAEEILDFGNGVGFAVVRMVGHPIGSEGEVRLRYASVGVWTDGLIVRITNYSDIDEARAAAERFAEERG